MLLWLWSWLLITVSLVYGSWLLITWCMNSWLRLHLLVYLNLLGLLIAGGGAVTTVSLMLLLLRLLISSITRRCSVVLGSGLLAVNLLLFDFGSCFFKTNARSDK